MKKIRVEESSKHGKGIFAAENIPKDAVIARISGKKRRKVSRNEQEALDIPTWFGAGRNTWIDPGESIFRYLNHSCEPNTAVIGTRTLIAMQSIAEGEEITIDYSMTDADPLWRMICVCGEKACRKVISSIHSVPKPVFTRHMPYIPQYFQRVYIRNHVNSKGDERDGRSR